MIRIRTAAVALAALPAAVRACVVYDPMPGWGGDPINAGIGVLGLGPAAFMALDLVSLLALALALLATPRVPLWSITLWLIGLVAVGYHALMPGHADLEHARIGLSWASALATALTATLCGQDPRLRRWMLAFGIGFVAMLASKGAAQVFIEHPSTLATFDADPAAGLRAQGLEPGTAAADLYERRLRGAEATGWFGLSNVYATFAAAAVVVFCPVLAGAIRRRQGATQIVCAAVGLLSATSALVMSDSKGGLAAAALGIAWCTLAPRVAPRLGPLAGLLGLGVLWAVILVVVLRGFIGTAFGELSILFRAYYIDAAARVFLDYPVLGIGPGDFRAGYLLHKPPLSPEEVTSPHSVLLDFTATLGLFGLAWAALCLRFAWRLGATRPKDTPTSDATPDRALDTRLLLIAAVLVTLASAWTEQHAALAELAVARILGLAAWVGAGYAILRTDRLALPSAAAATALLAHAMIEMTLTTPTSAPLVALIVGSACTLARQAPAPRRARACAGVVIALALGGTALLWLPTQRWSNDLAEARATIGNLASLRVGITSPDALVRQRAVRDLALAVRQPVPDRPEALAGAWAQLALARLTRATEHVADAHARAPQHLPTAQALTHLLTARLAIAQATGTPPSELLPLWIEAEAVAERMTTRRPAAAASWSRLASLRLARSEATGEPARLRGAIAPAREAAALDPRGPEPAARLARLHDTLGEPVPAAAWADRALALDTNRRLDPLRRFSDAQRAELQRIAASR